MLSLAGGWVGKELLLTYQNCQSYQLEELYCVLSVITYRHDRAAEKFGFESQGQPMGDTLEMTLKLK